MASSSSNSVSTLASAFQQNRSITTTDKSTPASFGDLRKAFERNPNSNSLFNEQRPSAPNARSTSTQKSSSLHVPAPSNTRPRSVSSPAPPHHEPEEPSSVSSGVEGIDNSQPDFGNLRARFQSQASLSSISLSKPVRLRKHTVEANLLVSMIATELCGLYLSAHFRSPLDQSQSPLSRQSQLSRPRLHHSLFVCPWTRPASRLSLHLPQVHHHHWRHLACP